jgi:glycosyltransferase involved in cell wall biosynthesis
LKTDRYTDKETQVPARLLDVTRLVSRIGRTPTGIDRVERAWLERLLEGDVPALGLLRTPYGFLLLDSGGLLLLRSGLEGGEWGQPDLLSDMAFMRPRNVRAMESSLRRAAVGRAIHQRLGKMLRDHLPPGTVSYNVGHSNLSENLMKAVKSVTGLRSIVMIHDTIPLDHPSFQRIGTAWSFAARFRAAVRHADVIICPSCSACRDVNRHVDNRFQGPRIVVAPLGVSVAEARPDELPVGLPPMPPYFVALGTIEPRKNHALLLDVWDSFGESAPRLLICGSRGWRNSAILARLDRGHPQVQEVAGLSDGAIAALLDGASALLFPSFTEGYGLPLVEALARGTPVICSDLPVCREVAGDAATYLDPRDRDEWKRAVLHAATSGLPRKRVSVPDWEAHFKTALSMLC